MEKQLEGSKLCKNLLEHSPNSKNFCLISYCHKCIWRREGTHWIYPKESPFFLPSRMKRETRPQFSLQKKTKSLWLFHIYIWAWREDSSSIKKGLEGQSWKSQCMQFPVWLCHCNKLNQNPKTSSRSIAVIRSKHLFCRYVLQAKEC